MIEITRLTKKLNGNTIIHDFSFQAGPAESVALLGHDGAGKTTLIKMLSGALKPSSGTIKIANLTVGNNNQKIKKLVGYQPELSLSHDAMSVRNFLHFMAEVRGFQGQEKRKAVDRAIARLELYEALHHPIQTLCNGLKRKVAIAQAILHDPALLLLDEPTEGLDAAQKNKIIRLVKSLNDPMTVIVASRHPEELARLCGRALVIANGRLMADTPMAELQRSSRHHRAVTLAADKPLDLLALAVLPGVAGIEEDHQNPGTVTVLAMPGQNVYPPINALIANRRWNINSLSLEPGRLNDVVQHLSKGAAN
ncbi:ABC transporter ATP-binding protein [Pseudomonas sp. SDO528_S397]